MAATTAFFGGAAIAACGAGGSSSSTIGGTHGSGAAGGGATTSTVGSGGDLGFDGGSQDAPVSDSDACGSVDLVAHTNPGNIVVVFDQSDSMNKPFTAGGATTPRWQVAEDAIVAAVAPNQATLNVGAIFFPTKATGNTCSLVDPIGTPPQIPIEPGATFTADFQSHFSAAGWKLILGTPLKIALDEANAALPDPSPLKGARAVVIITDGAPTCVTAQTTILGPVQAMSARGIKTYAVGLPGSASASNLLDAIANAGGTGSYLSPADPAALQAALAQISTSTIDQCTIQLDPPPADPSLVHLIVTDAADPMGYEIPLGADGGDGWTLSSDGTTATLVGGACDKSKDGTFTSLKFVYGCPTITPH